MQKRMRIFPCSQPGLQFLLILALVSLARLPLDAQEIHIKVLNGRNGKPITNECLNIWVGPMRGTSLVAPTNGQGFVVLHFDSDQVTAEQVSSPNCSRVAVLGPKAIPKGADTITVFGDEYVACQEYGKIVPGEPVTPDLVEQRMPSYPIKKILELGITAGNTCGKFTAQAKPGEVIFFVRPRTFLERMRL